MSYYISTQLTGTMEDAIESIRNGLQKEGFGVVTELDLTEKFKEKLGKEFRPYKILGACNPGYAYEVLQQEDKIGTMLPCNIIVQQLEDNRIEVAAIDPIASMQAVNNPNLGEIATEVTTRLKRVITSL